MKKVIALMCAITLLFSISTPIFAQGGTVAYVFVESMDEINWDNVPANTVYYVPNENVSDLVSDEVGTTLIPEPIRTRDHNIPTDKWDIVNDGIYTINGSNTLGTPLYTNYKFTGKTTYRITIKNSHTKDTEVQLKTFWGVTLNKTYTVRAGYTLVCFIEASEGIKSSDSWYIRFPIAGIYSGTVQ